MKALAFFPCLVTLSQNICCVSVFPSSWIVSGLTEIKNFAFFWWGIILETRQFAQRHQQDLYFTWAQGGLKNGIICTSFLPKTGWRWSGRVSFSKTRLIERVFSRSQEPRSFYALTQGPYSLCPVDQESGTWKDFHIGLFYRWHKVMPTKEA